METDVIDESTIRNLGLNAVLGIVRGMLTRINNYGAGIINFQGVDYVCGGATNRYLLLKKELQKNGKWNPEFDKHFDLACKRELNKEEMYRIELPLEATV